MVNHFPVSQNRKLPEPAPEPEELDKVDQDAIVGVVLNVHKEKRDGQSIAFRISFRLPDKP